MTRAEFDARYELIEQVAEGRVTTHHALHQSGAVVMVHFLGGTQVFQANVLDGVRRLGRGASEGKVLYLHEVDGQTVVVTRFLTEFVSLEHWFAEQGIMVAGEDPRPDPPAPADPAPASGPGEFTRMFTAMDQGGTEAPVVDEPAGAPPSDAAPPRSSLPVPPVTPREPPADSPSGPGEFTKLFQRPLEGAPADKKPDAEPPVQRKAAPPKDPPTPGEPSGPGEFTRLFQAKPADPDPDPWTDPARRPPPPPEPPPASRPPLPNLPAFSDASEGEGEFTRFFKKPEMPPEAPPAWSPPATEGPAPGVDVPAPPPVQKEDRSWSDALRSKGRPTEPPTSVPAPPPPAQASGGGEFTQIFGKEALSPPSAPATPSPPAPGRSVPPPPAGGSPAPGSLGQPPAVPRPPSAVPRVPKPRLPGAEALLRGSAPPRPPTPRMPPGGQVLRGVADAARSGAGGAAGSQGGSSDPQAGGGEQKAEGKRPSGVVFAVALTVVLVASLVLVVFFALWDFGGASASDEAVSPDPVPTDSIAS